MNIKCICRCIDMARLSIGNLQTNPAVGALIIWQNRIIGEGHYQRFGGAHAEVNAVKSVKETDLQHLPESTLYISLEPCNIYGKTPPCTELILRSKFKHVVFSQRDFSLNQKDGGYQVLLRNNINVTTGVAKKEGYLLSLPRNTFASKNRPYIVLKFAKDQQGFMASKNDQQVWLTNGFSRRLVHKWRHETDAVMIGSATAKIDNPSLTTRYYPGKSPIRIVINRYNDLSPSLQLLDDIQPTHIFTQSPPKANQYTNVFFHKIDFKNSNWLTTVLSKIKALEIMYLTIEGGVWLLNQFIDHNYWDEARVFEGKQNVINDGISAPTLPCQPDQSHKILEDQLFLYYNPDIWAAFENQVSS